MEQTTIEETYLKALLTGLVENPDAIEIKRTVDEMGVLLFVKVDPADMGNLIGREGKIAQSIRTLIRHVGMKNGRRVSIAIEDPRKAKYATN